MPDQTVEVTYDPNAEPRFTFAPDTVTMTDAGKVVLLRRPADAPWVFTDGSVKDDKLRQFSASVHGGGRLLHIRDDCKDKTKTPYDYNVTVTLNGYAATSPDPVIVNDPGGGGITP
jgi:hypothetical protein